MPICRAKPGFGILQSERSLELLQSLVDIVNDSMVIEFDFTANLHIICVSRIDVMYTLVLTQRISQSMVYRDHKQVRQHRRDRRALWQTTVQKAEVQSLIQNSFSFHILIDLGKREDHRQHVFHKLRRRGPEEIAKVCLEKPLGLVCLMAADGIHGAPVMDIGKCVGVVAGPALIFKNGLQFILSRF